MNERELQLGVAGSSTSWHNQYKHSAWVFIGGLPYDLTEGDVLCVFSQYGEIVNINLVRDKDTGKSKGFCFLCYEDQRSTILAVDNLNTIKILGRIIRVDHCEAYRPPKDHGDEDDVTQMLRTEGCAPKIEESGSEEDLEILPMPKVKKEKKKKKDKKKMKKEKKVKSESKNSADSSSDDQDTKKPIVKHERSDPAYDKYVQANSSHRARNPGRSQRSRESSRSSDSSSGQGQNGSKMAENNGRRRERGDHRDNHRAPADERSHVSSNNRKDNNSVASSNKDQSRRRSRSNDRGQTTRRQRSRSMSNEGSRTDRNKDRRDRSEDRSERNRNDTERNRIDVERNRIDVGRNRDRHQRGRRERSNDDEDKQLRHQDSNRRQRSNSRERHSRR